MSIFKEHTKIFRFNSNEFIVNTEGFYGCGFDRDSYVMYGLSDGRGYGIDTSYFRLSSERYDTFMRYPINQLIIIKKYE